MTVVAVRFAGVIAGLWAGILLCIGAIAAPSAFATLASADAGRAVARMFMHEANLVLLLGTLFCTVAGYFALQPMLAAARAGQGTVSFMALHAVSSGLFALKGLLVLALAWRLGAPLKTVATTS